MRTAVNFPFAENLKAVRIHYENSAGAFARSGAERAAENSLGTAVDGVRAAVAGAFGENIGLDYFYDFRAARVGFGVNNMDARGLDARDDQVAALRMGMRHVGAEACAAGIPAEVMEFVAGIRHIHTADNRAVRTGRGVHVHYAECVGAAVILGVEHGYEGHRFRWSLHGHFRRGIKRGIRAPEFHGCSPVMK